MCSSFLSRALSQGCRRRSDTAHIGTRQVPEQVNDLPFGSLKSIKSHGYGHDSVSAYKTASSTADVLDRTYGPELNKRVHRHARLTDED
jgi:hypothetical protein